MDTLDQTRMVRGWFDYFNLGQKNIYWGEGEIR